MLELFNGVGVIIDDAFAENEPVDGIWKIKEHLEKRNIPILTYKKLPPNEQIEHFKNICFLLLDWELYGALPTGISKPETAIDDNIEFIIEFNKVCFAPIFIFSNESPETIKNILEQKELYNNALNNNHIFVESKSNLKDEGELENKLNEWLTRTPSIYVLKKWENSLSVAKHNLFWDFYNINPYWPNILKQTFKIDGVDENHELSTLIYKNLIARSHPPEFDEDILKEFGDAVAQEDLRKY